MKGFGIKLSNGKFFVVDVEYFSEDRDDADFVSGFLLDKSEVVDVELSAKGIREIKS